MTPDESQRIKEVFFAACQAAPPDRVRIIHDMCREDASLRTKVEALLAADSSSLGGSEFLETPVFGRVLNSDRLAQLGSPAAPERLGEYQIVRKIAEGGMGVVYEARQEHPRRTVALKVIRSATCSPRLSERFHREADVLGRLQHPGIAHIYEAGIADVQLPGGATEAQPYFAMEFIQGQPLDAFAQAQQLDQRGRLTLLAKLCDAVQHAHERGVIHRDLKPSNILVEASGQPKVLDFGVARATDADVYKVTLQTDAGQLVGTIAYMSPEQAAGNPDQVDARSDVYSLGVIGYEMLSGQLPIEVRGRPIHEATRVIREADPVRLSAVSARFRGDIETIVGKALEKEKERRYQSAAALADDIRRHLRNEPITARPQSRAYRLAKFTRRNKVVVAATAAVFLAVLAGLGAASYGFVQASHQRDRALEELDRAEAVEQFFASMVQAARPDREGRKVTLLELLDRSSALMAEHFPDKPATRAVLHNAVGRTYRGLERFPEAQSHLEQAVQLAQESLGEHAKTAATLHNLAELYLAQQRFAEAEALLDRSLAMCRRLGDDLQATHVMNILATLYAGTNRAAEAEALYAQTLAIQQRVLGADNEYTLATLFNSAKANMLLGRNEIAERLFVQVLAGFEAAAGPGSEQALNTRNMLGELYTRQGRFAEAEPYYRAAYAGFLELYGAEAAPTVTVLQNLAYVCQNQTKLGEAEQLFRTLVDVRRRTLGEDHADYARALRELGRVCLDAKRYDEAAPLLAQALDAARRDPLVSEREIGLFLFLHAKCLKGLQRFDEAEAPFIDAHRRFVAAGPADRGSADRTRRMIVELYEAWGKPGKAAEWRSGDEPGP